MVYCFFICCSLHIIFNIVHLGKKYQRTAGNSKKFLILKKVAFYYTKGKLKLKQKHSKSLISHVIHVSLHIYHDFYVLFNNGKLMISSPSSSPVTSTQYPHYQTGSFKTMLINILLCTHVAALVFKN